MAINQNNEDKLPGSWNVGLFELLKKKQKKKTTQLNQAEMFMDEVV